MKKMLGMVPAVVLMLVALFLGPTAALADTFVMDYGAIGDGSHDDTAAIQSAVDAAPFGGKIIFPAETTFRINPGIGIRLKGNITLEMNGSTIAIGANVAPRSRIFETVPGSTNITIRQGTLVGSRTKVPGLEWMIGIRVDSASRVVISGMTIRDCYFDGIWVGGNQLSVGVTVEDTTIVRSRRNGISVVNARDVFVSRSMISGTSGQDPQSGINVEPGAGEQVIGFHVLDCVFSNNAGMGLYMHPGVGLPGSSYSVRRSQFIANGRFGLVGNSVNGLAVTDNLFTGHANRMAAAVSLGGGTVNASVSGNVLSGNHKGMAFLGVINVAVASNRITGLGVQSGLTLTELTRGSGIDIKGIATVATSGVSVTGNVVESATSFNFIVENASLLTIDGNVFRNSGRHNVFINTIKDSTFRQNRVEGAGQETAGVYDGIKLFGTTSDNIFLGNHVLAQERERKSVSWPGSCLRNTWVYNAVGGWDTRVEGLGATTRLNLDGTAENWNR